LAIVAVIFLCGGAVGSAITREYLHSRLYTAARERPIDAARRFGLHRLSVELHLTAEQEQAVTRELDDYAKYYQNIDEQREDVAEHGRKRILSVLNPDQRRRFTEIFGPAPDDLTHPFAH
jgi:hypothetical protein